MTGVSICCRERQRSIWHETSSFDAEAAPPEDEHEPQADCCGVCWKRRSSREISAEKILAGKGLAEVKLVPGALQVLKATACEQQ